MSSVINGELTQWQGTCSTGSHISSLCAYIYTLCIYVLIVYAHKVCTCES